MICTTHAWWNVLHQRSKLDSFTNTQNQPESGLHAGWIHAFLSGVDELYQEKYLKNRIHFLQFQLLVKNEFS